jgi:hypothetical protein
MELKCLHMREADLVAEQEAALAGVLRAIKAIRVILQTALLFIYSFYNYFDQYIIYSY